MDRKRGVKPAEGARPRVIRDQVGEHIQEEIMGPGVSPGRGLFADMLPTRQPGHSGSWT